MAVVEIVGGWVMKSRDSRFASTIDKHVDVDYLISTTCIQERTCRREECEM
jgi:uncharacterized protein YdcH (DUF465 family)